MKWVNLELTNLHAVERQVEDVIKTHEALAEQLKKRKGGNVTQVAKAQEVLRGMITQRVHVMERFYQENDLDPRSQRVEACRIKLKRVLKGLDTAGGGATEQRNTDQLGTSFRDERDNRGKSKASPHSKPGTSPSRGKAQLGAEVPAKGMADPIELGTKGKDGRITLKIQMTHSEFDTLRMRRQAMKELNQSSGKGRSGQAWENAFAAHHARAQQGLDAHSAGMNTFHDIPYQGDSFKQDALARNNSFTGRGQQPAFRSMMKPDVNPNPGCISSGPYQSANSEVVSRNLRGSAESQRSSFIDKKQSFRTVVPRTRVTTTSHKAESIGGLGY